MRSSSNERVIYISIAFHHRVLCILLLAILLCDEVHQLVQVEVTEGRLQYVADFIAAELMQLNRTGPAHLVTKITVECTLKRNGRLQVIRNHCCPPRSGRLEATSPLSASYITVVVTAVIICVAVAVVIVVVDLGLGAHPSVGAIA